MGSVIGEVSYLDSNNSVMDYLLQRSSHKIIVVNVGSRPAWLLSASASMEASG